MYFHDVHILIYVAIAILGFILGKFINYCNYKFLNEEKIISKDLFSKEKKYKNNIILPLINEVIYIILLYTFGIGKSYLDNI